MARRRSQSESSRGNPENKFEKRDVLKGEPSNYKIRHSTLKEYLIDYSTNSNLHGLKYIGERERTRAEKIFWLVMLVCCVVLCAGLMKRILIKWNENPKIVTVAENLIPVSQIPYPAVTVCSETKIMQRKFNFTEYYHLYYDNEAYYKLTEEKRHLFEDLTMVCDDHLAPFDSRLFSSGVDIVNNLKHVSPDLKTTVLACKWKHFPPSAVTDLFSPILTDEGICYTFNTLSTEEIFKVENLHTEYPYLEHYRANRSLSFESVYETSEPEEIETYPRRASDYGMKSGLTFLLTVDEVDLDYLCRGPVQGFKILLHNPAELPRPSQQYFRSPLSQELMVAIKPSLMTTAEELKTYDPVRRKCYFPAERDLKYFKMYTQVNCEIECLSNFTYARCGCVHFAMPRGPGINVCNSGSVACMSKSREIAHMKMVSACQCLLSCNSIKYEAETSQTEYDWRMVYKAYKANYTLEKDTGDCYMSRVMTFYKEAHFTAFQRVELDSQTFTYTTTDLLADCGGILGLFMGFSILSIAEIIYFLTLRLYYKYLRQRSQKKMHESLNNEECERTEMDQECGNSPPRNNPAFP